MQQGMVFHSLLAPQSGVNLQQIVATLHHELDLSAFHQAWQRTVQRHAILRTSFHLDGLKAPAQQVHTEVDLPFEACDWRDLSPTDCGKKIQAYLRTDRHRGFALDEPPLMRVTVFRWPAVART